MNIRRFLFPSVFICAALGLVLRLFRKRRWAKPASKSTPYDAIDAYVEEQMHRLNIPGVALAIVEGNQTVHQRGFGRARPGGEAPTPQTTFFIGSLTKSFTALAVMQLVEAGKIDLDAPVQRYLPWFRVADPEASAQMTVRHLLNQTSGLPTWSGEITLADFDDSPCATERQARALSTLELTRPVGSLFEYSNSNYNLLGLIIEAASGEAYADYVQKHIFTPLDMSHTYTSQAMAKRNGLAMGHQYWFTIPFPSPDMPVPHGSLPSGQLISSSGDLARYVIALLNGGRYRDVQILSSAGIDELHRVAADFSAMGLSLGQYGMGRFVGEIGGTKHVSHSGAVPHFAAYMALLPEQKKGVVLLFNASHHWMYVVLTDVGTGVAALLAGHQPAPMPIVGLFPWMLRGLLLIPALQIVGVVATLRLLRRWRLDPGRRPSGGRKWGLHILLPLVPNLLAALTLIPMLGKRRGYLMLYMPDFSWIAKVSGSFALVWSFLRTGLVFGALRKSSS
jgi:CubicO group peptidase (beta-lactamase class C family)